MSRRGRSNQLKHAVVQLTAGFLLLFLLPVTALGQLRCNDCHGTDNPADSRPLDAPERNILTGGFQGNHRTHMQAGASAGTCSICHPGSTSYDSNHRDGKIKLAGNINASSTGGVYHNLTSAFPQTSTPDLGKCSNVNCHFHNDTPFWGSTPLTAPGQCGTCHDYPPTTGSHPAIVGPGKKHYDYYGSTSSCAKCHVNHASSQTPFIHATSAGKRSLIVSFTTPPNSGGTYSGGDTEYPGYIHPTKNGTCSGLYCHSNGSGGAPNLPPTWGGTGRGCSGCHGGTSSDSTQANCEAMQGAWSSSRKPGQNGYCTPSITMTSNGHERLVGLRWIRQYPCGYCHYATADENGAIIEATNHVNGTKDVVISPRWAILGKPEPSYDRTDKKCYNVYCHSDGTTNPDDVRPYGWTEGKTQCNTCHGHPQGSCSDSTRGCHDGRTDSSGRVWVLPSQYGTMGNYSWPPGQEWKMAIPMYPNEGPESDRANTHMRHVQTNFTCDNCHAMTIANGTCTDCHNSSTPHGLMNEWAHLDGKYHADRKAEVVFKTPGANYNSLDKSCSGTGAACHSGGSDPQWGGSVNNAVTCLNCHGTAGPDVDSFGFILYSNPAKINTGEWATTGHGRPTAAGPYPSSGNPPANFPANPCWYCHDNTVLHNYTSVNPFRLRQHKQFDDRFQKECVYCHMTGSDPECHGCHNSTESLATQLVNIPADPNVTWPDGTVPQYNGVNGRPDHAVYANRQTSCITADCHYIDRLHPTSDLKVHRTGAGLWRADQIADVKNQYVMVGVCLKCHDDDTGGKCTICHSPPPNNPYKYSLGFRPYSGIPFIRPQKARATSVHFGYKHKRAYEKDGVWRGGKFCWDCHDPHGDGNIYMIQSKVATTTDGKFGIPKTRAQVSFTKKQSGLDYARINAPYDGICNVCHATQGENLSKHYGSDYGDGHNASRPCTSCHEHRFSDSHADGLSCTGCHDGKPIPRHSGFGQPKDCTKCHAGTIGMRMDIMGQMNANSHHVQGVAVSNKHCYACHWESTPEGLIDIRYHEGYNYKNYTSIRNAAVDLVVWQPGVRPRFFNTTTAIRFTAANIGTPQERAEVTALTYVCISCHNDGNNDTVPFNDCKTPRQYSWDGTSVAVRYSQTGTAAWGKYNSGTYPNANGKDKVAKAFSAHGNAVGNKGGYNPASGIDYSIPNTRDGGQNVQCFDCHSSHGSKVVGTTSSYVTFNGTHNGANLKETQAGKGGYSMSYKASSNSASGAVNPYNAGAGQCFDCHLTREAGTTPWGFQSTFGASQPIKGYFDSLFFGGTSPWETEGQYSVKRNRPVRGGHFKAERFLNHTTSAQNKINGLCTPCHDPHGVSPTLGASQAYAVPMLKGTWLTSPYREDGPEPDLNNPPGGWPTPTRTVHTDQTTFDGGRITEDDSNFAGLCLTCHMKQNLTQGPDKGKPWKSADRVHQSVKGWGVNDQHSYSCSKCHTPHASGLPRLMVTNCLDYKHRGGVVSGGAAGWAAGVLAGSGPVGPEGGNGSFPRGLFQQGVNCHPTGQWPDNSWNAVTPW